MSWTQHSESGIPHIYEWILVRCAFTYLIVGVLTHFDRLPQLAFVGKPCFGSFAIGETPGHPRLRDPNHQRVICKFKETSFQRMIGHVQKGTHSIGQLLQQIRNGWGENKRPLYHLIPPFKAFALCVCRYLRSFRCTTVNVPWRGVKCCIASMKRTLQPPKQKNNKAQSSNTHVFSWPPSIEYLSSTAN